ncbi:MAG: hypothetical protein ACR2NR_03890 [Solirubrobacteraceae bacterium]
MTTLLEQTMPVYHFNESHSRLIRASPIDVWQTLTALRLDQLMWFGRGQAAAPPWLSTPSGSAARRLLSLPSLVWC